MDHMGKRVVLVGVGHVFDIAPQIKEVVEYVKPDIITLELDKRRFHTILSQESGKNVPFFYKLLGKMQENIAKKYGVETGSEMLAAVEKAKELDISVECIDMDAQRVFLKLWKNMPLRKKVSLIIGGVTGLFLPKKKVEKEIKLFEENADEYLSHFEKYFPHIKKILIDERNMFMAQQLKKFLQHYSTIISIVGEGHMYGLEKILQEYVSVIVIHLSDLRDDKWEKSYCKQIQSEISSTTSSSI